MKPDYIAAAEQLSSEGVGSVVPVAYHFPVNHYIKRSILLV